MCDFNCLFFLCCGNVHGDLDRGGECVLCCVTVRAVESKWCAEWTGLQGGGDSIGGGVCESVILCVFARTRITPHRLHSGDPHAVSTVTVAPGDETASLYVLHHGQLRFMQCISLFKAAVALAQPHESTAHPCGAGDGCIHSLHCPIHEHCCPCHPRHTRTFVRSMQSCSTIAELQVEFNGISPVGTCAPPTPLPETPCMLITA
jgi:hypothetical protein